MTIITQEIKNEAIKILNNVTKNVFFNYSNDLTSLFFSKHPSVLIVSKLKQLIISIYEKVIPLIDKMFLNSNFRKQNFFKSKSCERTIVNVFGELNFKRNYYVDKDKKNGFFFIDLIFNFEQFSTYDPLIRAILIDRSTDTNANNTSLNYDLNLFNLEQYLSNNVNLSIPRQTIYNWIHKWKLPKVEYKYFDNDSKHLYIMVDEKWIHEQIRLANLPEKERDKHHFIMSKCFVTFTGAKTKNNRTTLLNKHIFMTTSQKPWKEFMDEIYNIYNYENFEEIYLLSDSGTWILAGTNELKLFPKNTVILNTCEFHVKQYINRITKDRSKRLELYDTIYEKGDKKKFEKLSNLIIAKVNNKSKKEAYKNYILNHWKSILNMKDRQLKSSMESHISHCIASHFTSRPKGYSSKRIEKYIKLQEYKLNGINIMDLYLNSYNKNNDYIYNKKEISYSIFEHNTSILPVKSSCNPISNILNNLAYN